MDERRAVEVLRELRNHGDIADWWELDAALDHVTATIERERWRPIAEAPKDGTFVLGWREAEFWPSGIHRVVAYDSGERHWTDGAFESTAPTHWRPLPDPQPDGQEG